MNIYKTETPEMSPFKKDIIVAVFLEKKMVFKTSPVCWPRVDNLLLFSSNFLQSYKPLASTDAGIEGSRENEINQSFHHLTNQKCIHIYYLYEIISCRNVAPREIWVCGPRSYSSIKKPRNKTVYLLHTKICARFWTY